jgi:hypothetical protein
MSTECCCWWMTFAGVGRNAKHGPRLNWVSVSVSHPTMNTNFIRGRDMMSTECPLTVKLSSILCSSLFLSWSEKRWTMNDAPRRRLCTLRLTISQYDSFGETSHSSHSVFCLVQVHWQSSDYADMCGVGILRSLRAIAPRASTDLPSLVIYVFFSNDHNDYSHPQNYSKSGQSWIVL